MYSVTVCETIFFCFLVVRNLYRIRTRFMHKLQLLTDMLLVSVLVLVLVSRCILTGVKYIIAWQKYRKAINIQKNL